MKIRLSLSILILFAFPLVFAEEFENNGIIASTDQSFYETGELLIFSGQVEEKKMPELAIRVFDPDGTILSANNIEIKDDNSFSKTISLDSPLYDESGTYTIKIDYGTFENKVFFDIVSGYEEILESEELPILEIIFLETDKPAYTDNETITISGTVSSNDESLVLVGIRDPFGNPTGFYFGDVNSYNEFSVSFLAKAGVNFKVEGKYSVIAYFGDSEYTTHFDFLESLAGESTPIETEDDIILEESESENNHSILEEKETKKVETKTEKNKENDVTKPKDDKIKKPQIKSEAQSNNEKSKVLKEKTPKPNNLTVEDIELGKLLNQINLNCDDNDYIDIISYYDGLGPALIRLCNYSEAISYFDNDIADDPNNVEYLTNKGATLAKLEHLEEAILHYDSSLEIDSSYVPALNNKANALSKLGKFDEASAVYAMAIQLEPENKILNENFEKSQAKIIPTPNHQETTDTISDQKINKKSDESEIKTGTNSKTPNLFEQIGNVFSSIGSIFGLKI